MKTSRSAALLFTTRLLAALTSVSALVLVAGCGDVPNSEVEAPVVFNTTPSHANVTLDGNVLGTTPFSVVLGKQAETHIVVKKPGFKTVDVYVHSVGGTLVPNPVKLTLQTELLPDKPGADPKAELANCLENLKKYVAAGTISTKDAPFVEAQIREFYK